MRRIGQMDADEKLGNRDGGDRHVVVVGDQQV